MYDGIVIGGGHNGLTCAAYLAKAGLRIAVVERDETTGGGCSTRELTLPGFRHNPHSNYHTWEQGPVPRDLELERNGLRYVYPAVQHAMVLSDDTAVCIHRDPDRTAASFRRFSARDAQRYVELADIFGRQMADLSTQLAYSPPLPPAELAERISGELGREFLAYGASTLHEAVDHNFEDERVRCIFKSFMHALALENVPGSGAHFPRMMSRMTSLGLPVGGAMSVAHALDRVVERHGGTVLRRAHVAAITSDDAGVTGVRLDDGRTLTARRFVVSAVDAPQTIRLAGEDNFPATIVAQLRDFQWASHSLVTLHLALDEPPRYRAAAFDPDVDAAYDLILGVDGAADIERTFADVHAGLMPARAAGNGGCPSRFDETLAPHGRHLAFWWPWAPYDLDGDAGNWDVRRAEIADDLLEQWGRYASNLDGARVLARALFTPLDIERGCITMQRGSHHVGAYTADQLGANRPIPALSDYRTPLAGLYLCGSSSHPGGSVSGAPGYNAANVIAQDLELERWWTPVAAPHWPPSHVDPAIV